MRLNLVNISFYWMLRRSRVHWAHRLANWMVYGIENNELDICTHKIDSLFIFRCVCVYVSMCKYMHVSIVQLNTLRVTITIWNCLPYKQILYILCSCEHSMELITSIQIQIGIGITSYTRYVHQVKGCMSKISRCR